MDIKNLTAEELGNMLYEEFERDNWEDTDIDPFWFETPQGKLGRVKRLDDTYNNLQEVLKRVAERIRQYYLG